MWLKKNKYGAKRTNGFPSKLENDTHEMLKLMVASGEYSNLQCQHCVSLTKADIRCKIDFSVINLKTGEIEFFEAKGFDTDRWKIIKKLWLFYGPSILYVYKKNKKGLYLDEAINPKCNK
jgi:hypothetical protein